MASGNRASMREGPLADLFRKTAEDEEAKPQSPQRRDPRARQPEKPEPRSLRQDEEEPKVPSPTERLSAAFSHDIPHDLLERPAQTARRPRDEPSVTPRAARH